MNTPSHPVRRAYLGEDDLAAHISPYLPTSPHISYLGEDDLAAQPTARRQTDSFVEHILLVLARIRQPVEVAVSNNHVASRASERRLASALECDLGHLARHAQPVAEVQQVVPNLPRHVAPHLQEGSEKLRGRAPARRLCDGRGRSPRPASR